MVRGIESGTNQVIAVHQKVKTDVSIRSIDFYEHFTLAEAATWLGRVHGAGSKADEYGDDRSHHRSG